MREAEELQAWLEGLDAGAEVVVERWSVDDLILGIVQRVTKTQIIVEVPGTRLGIPAGRFRRANGWEVGRGADRILPVTPERRKALAAWEGRRAFDCAAGLLKSATNDFLRTRMDAEAVAAAEELAGITAAFDALEGRLRELARREKTG